MLLNNPYNRHPKAPVRTKALINQDTHKPTGGIWTTGVGVKEWPWRKNIFRKKEKTPSTKGEVD